jgi:ATP-dependent helicase/nuclease subunit A
LDRRAAADFGSAVHAFLAQVAWGDEIEGFSSRNRKPGASADDAWAEALACLRSPELASVWARPEGEFSASEVWRERAFEIVLDGVWITGIFDRVIVIKDASGRALRATVFDFKTDQVTGEKSVAMARLRHAPQLEIYRRAVSILAGVRLKDVEAKLVLTRLRQVVPTTLSAG